MSIATASRRATRVLTVSESSKRDILRFVDIDPEKIDVIYNGYDERFAFEPMEEDVVRVRERYQLHDEFVLYAGNVKPHKNLERLIDAFHLVRKQGLDHLKLVLIGAEISKYAALRRAVHRHQLHKYVRFLGYLPEETLAVMYRLGGRFRVSIALRRVRIAPPRGDGQRHAGGDLERLVAARSRRRRGSARQSLRPGGDRRRASIKC